MEIKVLINDSGQGPYLSEHGLSLYIKTAKHKILFDLGASSAFYKNARKLAIDLNTIDYIVISHGHYDHTGGLKTIFDLDLKAEIFINHNAFKNLYSKKAEGLKEIGLRPSFLKEKRVILTGKRFFISLGLQLFTTSLSLYPEPLANKDLLWKESDEINLDPFLHEQSLLIEEDNKIILVAGCAHKGILNILERAKHLKGRYPDYVISGFHLLDKPGNETKEMIEEIAQELKKTKATYYTGHCTGVIAYEQLKAILQDKIHFICTGLSFTI